MNLSSSQAHSGYAGGLPLSAAAAGRAVLLFWPATGLGAEHVSLPRDREMPSGMFGSLWGDGQQNSLPFIPVWTGVYRRVSLPSRSLLSALVSRLIHVLGEN